MRIKRHPQPLGQRQGLEAHIEFRVEVYGPEKLCWDFTS
jgi:hypothetical protein